MFLSGMLAWGRTRVKTNAWAPLLRSLRWLAALVWMGGIFYLSHQSAPLGQTASTVESIAVHLGLYAGLALLMCWALAGSTQSRMATPNWVPAAVAFALTVLYGVSDELHQAFVPGRTASEVDIAFDAVGAALGVALALFIERFLSPRFV